MLLEPVGVVSGYVSHGFRKSISNKNIEIQKQI
jgi:hypothetical protein